MTEKTGSWDGSDDLTTEKKQARPWVGRQTRARWSLPLHLFARSPQPLQRKPRLPVRASASEYSLKCKGDSWVFSDGPYGEGALSSLAPARTLRGILTPTVQAGFTQQGGPMIIILLLLLSRCLGPGVACEQKLTHEA